MTSTSLSELLTSDSGTLQIAIALGDADGLFSEHRATLTLGQDLAAFFVAINADIVSRGYPALSDSDVADITSAVAVALTPERIAALEAAAVANAPTLAVLKAQRLAAINQHSVDLLGQIKAGYPDDEVQSWSKQEAEARAFVADSTAATPLLSAMATARGLQVVDLAGRVIVKADAFAVASGQIIGTRQRCEDEITAAQTTEALAAVAW